MIIIFLEILFFCRDNLSPWEVLLFDDEDNDIGQFLVLTKLALPRLPLVMDKRGTNFIPG